MFIYYTSMYVMIMNVFVLILCIQLWMNFLHSKLLYFILLCCCAIILLLYYRIMLQIFLTQGMLIEDEFHQQAIIACVKKLCQPFDPVFIRALWSGIYPGFDPAFILGLWSGIYPGFDPAFILALWSGIYPGSLIRHLSWLWSGIYPGFDPVCSATR